MNLRLSTLVILAHPLAHRTACSMCRIEYSADWHHDPNRHCPNLIPDSMDLQQFGRFLKEGQPVNVHVKYSGFWKHHDSLVGMWNDWYREYYDGVEFDRRMVSYEDLLFFPWQVTDADCTCCGCWWVVPT